MAVHGLRFAALGREQIEGRIVLSRECFDGLKRRRLETAVPTVAHARRNGAACTYLLSHDGRPDEAALKIARQRGLSPDDPNVVREMKEQLAMSRAVPNLTGIFRQAGVLGPAEEVYHVEDIFGPAVSGIRDRIPLGSVVLLGNSRFFPGDVAGSPQLASAIVEATGAKIVVANGFGVLHRADHASVGGIARAVMRLNGLATLGPAADQEIRHLLDAFVEHPLRPYVGVFGGAKVTGKEGKIVILKNLLRQLDKALIGGAMVYPFLVAVYGAAKAGEDPLAAIRKDGELDADIVAVKEILASYSHRVVLPEVFVVQKGSEILSRVSVKDGIPAGFAIRDLEPIKLQELLETHAGDAQTFVVNGAVGKTPEFSVGTRVVFSHATYLTTKGANTALAGGETTADAKAARSTGVTVEVSFEPTAGGAFLEVLGSDTLPIESCLSLVI